KPTTPAADRPAQPGTPAKPATPAADRPAKPATPAADRPAKPATPAADRPATPAKPATPAADRPATPAKPAIPQAPADDGATRSSRASDSQPTRQAASSASLTRAPEVSLTPQAHGRDTGVGADNSITGQQSRSPVLGVSPTESTPAPETRDRFVVVDLRSAAPSAASHSATSTIQGAIPGSEEDTDLTRELITAPRSEELITRTDPSPAVLAPTASWNPVVALTGSRLPALPSLLIVLTGAGHEVCQVPASGVDRSRTPLSVAEDLTGGRGSLQASDHVVALAATDVPLTSPVGTPPLPAAPAAPVPVGPVASTGMSGTTCGGGQNHQSCDDDAVLDEDLAASVALMAARVASGVAGHVLGTATDPGSRPD
ncbi:hypothetical protein SAMN05660642_04320, partial [Geodermatophilus siccatus]